MSILENTKKPLKKSMNRGNPVYLPSVDKVILPVFKCGYTSSHAAFCPHGKVLASFNDLIDYEGVEKVTMVRNPYDRIVSLYTCKNNRDHLDEFSSSFEQFVENVKALLDNGFQDGHYNSLVANLSIKGEFMPNKIFKLEEKQEYLDYIGLDVSFPKKNSSVNRKPYQDYYTQKSFDMVTEMFKEDLELFDYHFE